MTELHISLEPFAGREMELESAFRGVFVPAIAVQQGFRRVSLLKEREALRRYRIVLAFDSEPLRLKWASSPEHQVAFPALTALCNRISWMGFEVVEEKLPQ